MNLILFPDPRTATLGVLRAILPAYSSAAIGTMTPEELGDRYPGPPYVMVGVDAGYDQGVAIHAATIRVLSWAETSAKSYALAQTARAILLQYEGDSLVRSFRPQTGPIPTVDPDSPASPLTYFTVTARLRPVPLDLPVGYGAAAYGGGSYGG